MLPAAEEDEGGVAAEDEVLVADDGAAVADDGAAVAEDGVAVADDGVAVVAGFVFADAAGGFTGDKTKCAAITAMNSTMGPTTYHFQKWNALTRPS